MEALNRFMRDLAEVVRIPPPRRGDVAVGEVVQEIASLLRPELAERKIELTVDLDGQPVISADRAQLGQAVLNIIRNAVDAAGENGRISVMASARGLVVADNGPGIPDNVRADLFTPFFSTRHEGRGLGLTIVQEILTNHGFAYSLQNRPEGGAAFRITW
jgi:signal transduction histidine kinase